MSDLKPCPFCGCGNVTTCMDAEQGQKWGYAGCDGCGARGSEVRTGYDAAHDAPWHDEAIAAWNTRTDLIQPMIDKAVAEVLERAARRVETDRHTIPSDCFCSGRKDGGPTRCFDWMQRNAAYAIRALIPKKGGTHE